MKVLNLVSLGTIVERLCTVSPQHIIDALNRLPVSPAQSNGSCVQLRNHVRASSDDTDVTAMATLDVEDCLTTLRQRMRKLRRWRNGSESWSVPALEELVDFLLLTRASVVTYRLSLLLASVERLHVQWQVTSVRRLLSWLLTQCVMSSSS